MAVNAPQPVPGQTWLFALHSGLGLESIAPGKQRLSRSLSVCEVPAFCAGTTVTGGLLTHSEWILTSRSSLNQLTLFFEPHSYNCRTIGPGLAIGAAGPFRRLCAPLGVPMLRFDYLEARNLRHAISLLQRHGEEARLVAGSTDFLGAVAAGILAARMSVINSSRGISSSIRRVTYSAPANGLNGWAPWPTVQAYREPIPSIRRRITGALATGATSFAGVQVRNLATVGGNVVQRLTRPATPCPLFSPLTPNAEYCRSGRFTARIPADRVFPGAGPHRPVNRVRCSPELRLPPPQRPTPGLFT